MDSKTVCALLSNSSPDGTSKGILSSRIFCLARTRRLLMFSSLLRNALAISGMLKPQRVLRTRAICESFERVGWQHVNISLNWSSTISCSEKKWAEADSTVYLDGKCCATSE